MALTNRRQSRRPTSGKGRATGKVLLAGKGQPASKGNAPGAGKGHSAAKGKFTKPGKAGKAAGTLQSGDKTSSPIRGKAPVRGKDPGKRVAPSKGSVAGRDDGPGKGRPAGAGSRAMTKGIGERTGGAASRGGAASNGGAASRGSPQNKGRGTPRNAKVQRLAKETSLSAAQGKSLRKASGKPSGKSMRSGPAPANSSRWSPGLDPSKGQGLGPSEPMRIAKAMARSGLCSRREAERWIEARRVKVNGKFLETPAFEVGPKDRIEVDGKPMPNLEPTSLWRYNKPRGLVTTHADPQERPTVFDALPCELPRVISVGRLDFNTEGLLLLTNDGELARHLELPATGWARRYRVRAYGRVSQAELDKLKDGLTVEGVRYGPVAAKLDSVQGGNSWLTLSLSEGKNREVRKILEHLELKVNRLIRVSYGPFQLADLGAGEVEPVRRRTLCDQLGLKIAHKLGLVDKAGKSTERRARTRKPGRSVESGGSDEAGGTGP